MTPTTSASSGHARLHLVGSQMTATPPHGRVIPIGDLFEQVTTSRRIVCGCARRAQQLGPVLHSTARSVSGREREQ